MLTMSPHLPGCPGWRDPWAWHPSSCSPALPRGLHWACHVAASRTLVSSLTQCCAVCRAGSVGRTCCCGSRRLVTGEAAPSPGRRGGLSSSPPSGLRSAHHQPGGWRCAARGLGRAGQGDTTRRTSPSTASAPQVSELWRSRVLLALPSPCPPRPCL